MHYFIVVACSSQYCPEHCGDHQVLLECGLFQQVLSDLVCFSFRIVRPSHLARHQYSSKERARRGATAYWILIVFWAWYLPEEGVNSSEVPYQMRETRGIKVIRTIEYPWRKDLYRQLWLFWSRAQRKPRRYGKRSWNKQGNKLKQQASRLKNGKRHTSNQFRRIILSVIVLNAKIIIEKSILCLPISPQNLKQPLLLLVKLIDFFWRTVPDETAAVLYIRNWSFDWFFVHIYHWVDIVANVFDQLTPIVLQRTSVCLASMTQIANLLFSVCLVYFH